MRLIDTDRYEQIINDVQTSQSAISIDGEKGDMKHGLEKLATVVLSGQLRQEGYIFIMHNDLWMKMMTVAPELRYDSACMGHQIKIDADMPLKNVLFVDTDSITLSGKLLDIERIGVVDFSENDTEQET